MPTDILVPLLDFLIVSNININNSLSITFFFLPNVYNIYHFIEVWTQNSPSSSTNILLTLTNL